LRTQIAALPQRRDLNRAANNPPGQAFPQINALGQPLVSATGDASQGTNAAALNAPDIPQEGDEILLEPKSLAKLLPEFNWEALERKEPIAVRALLEQHGIVFTNYQELASRGITNYIIQRNRPRAPDPAQPKQ
jgi:hypothetical protein